VTLISRKISLLKSGMVTRIALGLGLLCGCERRDEITVYTVPRHDSLQSPEYLKRMSDRRPQPARMLASIVPHDTQLWFFKLQGAPDVIAAHESEYDSFLKSVRFPGSPQVTWTLPAGWKEMPGRGGRFSTLIIGEPMQLELTVTVLSQTGEDLNQQRLKNINRWRGQLNLPSLEEQDLPLRSKTLKIGDSVATVIDITGVANPANSPPGGTPTPPPTTGQPVTPENTTTGSNDFKKSDLKFNKPTEWTEIPRKQFQLARLTVGEGDRTAEIAVSRVGGDRLANINRWRSQIGLETVSSEELKQFIKPFEVDSQQGEFIELVSGEKTILGVMIPDHGQTWFIKLTGSSELAIKERQRFEAFAKSLKLE